MYNPNNPGTISSVNGDISADKLAKANARLEGAQDKPTPEHFIGDVDASTDEEHEQALAEAIKLAEQEYDKVKDSIDEDYPNQKFHKID